MVRHDLKSLGKCPTFSPMQSAECVQTFVIVKSVVRAGRSKIKIGPGTAVCPPQEVPQSSDQDGNTSDTTDDTAGDCADRRRHYGGRGGLDSGNSIDTDEVEDESVGLVGRTHCDVDMMSTICQSICIEVDDPPRYIIQPWTLRHGCGAKLSECPDG